MAKSVLAIVGSPRGNSNSERLARACLDAAAESGAETRLFSVRGKQIAHCRACAECAGKGDGTYCVVNDDVLPLLDDMVWADAIVFASPTYMAGMSAQMKTLMDRTRPLWIKGNCLQSKTASFIAVGDGRWGGQELAIRSMMDFALNHGMIVVGSACLDWGNWEVIGQAREPGEVAGDQFALEAARGLGRRIAALSVVFAPTRAG